MSIQTKIWLGKKFFSHLTPYYQFLAVEAALQGMLCVTCLAVTCLAVGCARFDSQQIKIGPDGTRTESHQTLTTFAASKANIAKLRASTTDKSQGLTVGGLEAEANAADLVAAAVKAAVEAAK